MRGISLGKFWLVLLVTLLGLTFLEARAEDLPDIIERIRPSIVAVGTVQPTRRPPANFLATGFVVADGRHVITNAHVLPVTLDKQQKEYLAIFVGRGQRFEGYPAEPVAVDDEHDLALLKMTGAHLPALILDGARPSEGQRIAFTGFPIGMVLGLFPVTHQGIISAITPIAIPAPSARQLDPTMIRRLRAPYEVFQLDATAYPGNSGSPLYEPQTGRVIGVINRVFVQESKEKILESPSGITYAVPIRHAKDLLRRAGLN